MSYNFSEESPLEISLPVKPRASLQAWESSPFYPLVNQDNQNKGKIGVHIVQQVYGQILLQELQIINNNGDLINLIDNQKREVKTCFRADGKEFWFNQIRMMQRNEWQFLDLVFITPKTLWLYTLTRDQVLELLCDDSPLISDGHIGVDNLEFLQIKVKSNSKTNQFPLLDKYGTCVLSISSSEIKINAESTDYRN